MATKPSVGKETERRLQALFEQAPIGVAFLDTQFTIEDANSVFAGHLGAPSSRDLIGLRIPGDFGALDFDPEFLADLRDQRRVHGELSGGSPWGRSVRLAIVASPISHSDADSYLIISRDSSEQHRLEAEAKQNAARNEAILNATVDGIATIDSHGTLISVNRGLEDLFGYDRDELLGENVRVLMPEPYRSEHDQYLARYLETRRPRIIGIGREVEGRRRDGSTFPVRLSIGEIDLEGEILFVGILGDLSQQQDAEREAGELGVILEDSLNEIFVFDDQTLEFRIVNRGARENLGYSLEELRTLAPFDIKPEFTEAEFRRLITPVKTGVTPRLEFKTTHRRKDGTEYRVEVHVQHRADSHEYVAIIVDITDREILERQLQQSQRMEAVGRLAGGIAHDFNNLLTSIQGSSELILSRLDDGDRSTRALERIQKAAARGAALTRHLLAFSRRQVSQPRSLDINNVITEICDLAGRLIGEDVELVLELDTPLPPVQADPTQIDQTIMNLVVNASDAMPTGGTLTVSTRSHAVDPVRAEALEITPGDAIEIEIRDTGVGIAQELQSQIFEPFFTTKEVGKGTGLGLSTVYGIAKQCGWGIEVDSTLGVGSTFTIWIPFSAGAARPVEAPIGIPEEKQSSGSAGVLLVEDDALLREHAIDVLEDAGFSVVGARDPEEAIERVKDTATEIDLLVSDVVMPGMTGVELVRQLREHHPHLRVLLMSGYTEANLAQREALPPEFPILSKPFSNHVLLKRIRELMKP